MSVYRKLKRAARGEVKPTTAALETLRRTRVALSRRSEMRSLEKIGSRGARLTDHYARMTSEELLAHFRQRTKPGFFPGLRDPQTGKIFQHRFAEVANELIAQANNICDHHRWPLLGFGETSFGDPIEWRRDPISSFVSPLTYHREVQLLRPDGSDARVLWELNRLGHLITLGRAYAVTRDEKFTDEFLRHLRSWSEQNPYGYGPNWHCAMEVALRAMNLLVAFELFRDSPELTEQSLPQILSLLDQHGTYIENNPEFSYIATSNHYFSDVIGLLWLGIMLPELRHAAEWRQFGLSEMLREMDKQVLPDGADFESSTGYHRYILELVLYSFLLCRLNDIDVPDRYWEKLRKMLEYVRGYLRPDGLAPLIGDSDGGQVTPMRHRAANDHAYLLSLGAVAFNDSSLKLKGVDHPDELLWLFGEEGLSAFESLSESMEMPRSISFPDAGVHILRHEDLYLSLNTSDAGINGRGSHGHNDALSIEVAACGRTFIADPGTFVYTGDLLSRHKFRSTAFHSTVEVDEEEQNTTNINMPFVIGNDAKPRVLFWETGKELDKVSAEHCGYKRLPNPLTHRRTICFNKTDRCWLIDDEFIGQGEHEFLIRFHLDAGLEVTPSKGGIMARDRVSGAGLVIRALTFEATPELQLQSVSYDYGHQTESTTACWTVVGRPSKMSWLIVPVCAGEVEVDRVMHCKNRFGTN
ncbi:MAG TPA: alginate lyase family protein [Pyrinomonadaceae bacterium]|nr:alginate lyase family protein [Pyrinomonadaceae bacterium]